MANEFSFGPNPAYPFGGSGAVMGRALMLGLTNGLSLMDMFDQFRRHNETTPSWVAAQQARNGMEQSAANLHSLQDQNSLGAGFSALGLDPAHFGYGPQSIAGHTAQFSPLTPSITPGTGLPALPAAPSHSAPLPDPNGYGNDTDYSPVSPWGYNGGW